MTPSWFSSLGRLRGSPNHTVEARGDRLRSGCRGFDARFPLTLIRHRLRGSQAASAAAPLLRLNRRRLFWWASRITKRARMATEPLLVDRVSLAVVLAGDARVEGERLDRRVLGIRKLRQDLEDLVLP